MKSLTLFGLVLLTATPLLAIPTATTPQPPSKVARVRVKRFTGQPWVWRSKVQHNENDFGDNVQVEPEEAIQVDTEEAVPVDAKEVVQVDPREAK